MTILALPTGMTADKSADFGLLGLMNNVNAYSITPQAAIVTAGTNSTLTAAQATKGNVVLTAGASGGFTITLPSTAAIIAAMGPTIPTDGTYGEVFIVQNNNVGQTGTLTAGDASTTISGTATIATNTTRIFFLSITSATAITFTNFGSLTL